MTITEPVLRAHRWPNNSALIADVHRLGYINDTDVVLDPTFGKGNWWNEYRPQLLVDHDLKIDGVDFRALPEPDGYFDVVAFDPPYIAPGSRDKSTIGQFNDAYGIDHCPRTPAELHDMIVDGLHEFRRVLKPKGILLVKAMNYVTSGKYLPAAYDILDEATSLGFTLIDEFVHIGNPGPQPKGRGQKHSRANYSNLFVLRGPR